MLNTTNIEELAKLLYKALPAGFQTIEFDIKQTFKDILNAGFTRMDLVTREEFDVQVNVLSRSRDKIEALEAKLKTIDAKSSSID